MSSIKRKCSSLLCALLALLLCACGEKPDDSVTPPEEDGQPFILSVSVPDTDVSETIMVHRYENLMRWVDGGDGWAVLVPGLAESYEMETDYAGNATYTFTLREGICWSNGEPITASDFVCSWQTLADEGSNFPHQELLSCIARFDEEADTDEEENAGEPADDAENQEEQETQEPETTPELAVSAPDARTFVVTLKGNPAYFLEEVCASVYTVPGAEQFPSVPESGPYMLAEADPSHVTLVRNENYYAPDPAGPEEIHFYTAGESEYQQLQEGSRGLITALPADVLQELADSGLWTPDPVAETYGVLLNTQTAPFDNENVRMAFHLAVDRQAVVETLGDLTMRPALGLVPYGVSDYSERPAVEDDSEDEDTLPDPNAEPEPEEPAPTCWDFRSHALEVVTAEHTHEYETDRSYAQALLANAGYPGGSGFPEVEYIYVEQTELDAELARILQNMWKETLGVSVTIRGVSQSEYDAALTPALPEEGEENEEPAASESEDSETVPVPSFQMAAQALSPAYSDAEALLECWHSGSEENVTGYASDAFDILLNSAQAAVSPDARDAYLHDAEAILLEDSPVIPVLCRGGSFRLAEGLTGLYRAPDGVFFLYNIHRDAMAG